MVFFFTKNLSEKPKGSQKKLKMLHLNKDNKIAT